MDLDGNGVSKSVENNCSCKISVNAKGLWSGELKVYSQTVGEAMSIAFIKAEELSAKIRIKNLG